MKLIFSLFISLIIISFVQAQTQPGLHIEKNHTVLFGQDTISSGLKFMWQPSKGAFRVGNMTSAWNYSSLGNISSAFGSDTQAGGNYSFATGLGTWANSFTEFSIGRYSLGGGSQTIWNNTTLGEVVFEVGNGTGPNASSRSNMFTIQKSGNLKIGNMSDPLETIDEKLVVDGGIVLGSNVDPSPAAGTIRWNASTSNFEGWDGSVWQTLTTNDDSPTNEIELPSGGSSGDVLTTNGSGNYSWNASRGVLPEGAIPYYGKVTINTDGVFAIFTLRPMSTNFGGFTSVPSGKYFIVTGSGFTTSDNNGASPNTNYTIRINGTNDLNDEIISLRGRFEHGLQSEFTNGFAPLIILEPGESLRASHFNFVDDYDTVRVFVRGWLVDDISY